jgi:hypothetical protein
MKSNNIFNTLKCFPPEAIDAGKLTKICSEMVALGNTPEIPSSGISGSNSFGLQSNLKSSHTT